METSNIDELTLEAARHFQRMVQSVGVKRFAAVMQLSTRQINRMLAGTQPNPVDRIVKCLQSCEPEIGDDVLQFICQEAGGLFIKEEGSVGAASTNAVRECAQAIDAIADGEVSRLDEKDIREAICSLTALLRLSREQRRDRGAGTPPPIEVATRRLAGARAERRGAPA